MLSPSPVKQSTRCWSDALRVIGIDLGSKRIGVAASDLSGTLASPVSVIQRSGDERQDHREILKVVQEYEAVAVVVGLPISMSGELGAAAQAASAESERLASVVGVPVHLHDERLTTKTAEEALIQNKMKAQARRRVIDKVAAAVMLQSWLDAQDGQR
jgi:putative Holliday junction resolvase